VKERETMQGTVTMYSTTWCGYCRRLKSQMEREGIAYTEIDIEQDPTAIALVEKANGGNRTVPTVVIAPRPGGSEVTMTNPSLAQVKQALTAA
jgi:mycoredoxin